MDLSTHRRDIAKALTGVETSLHRLVDALAHRPSWICVEGAANEKAALRKVCDAYGAIDYGMEDAVSSSVMCLGVVGVSSEVLKRAEAVNSAKAALKRVCVPLQGIRTRVPMKGEGGRTKAIPLIRLVLRNIQRSDLNLLAAYRKIPILGAPPSSIVYTLAHTRAVYRKSIDEIADMLRNLEGRRAEEDRARLESLTQSETHLAIVRERYQNIRANVLYAHLDPRGRGRIQIAAELPLMYATGRRNEHPVVQLPDARIHSQSRPRRGRTPMLEVRPYLQSVPAHRYVRPVSRLP